MIKPEIRMNGYSRFFGAFAGGRPPATDEVEVRTRLRRQAAARFIDGALLLGLSRDEVLSVLMSRAERVEVEEVSCG